MREEELVASLALDLGQAHVPMMLAVTPDTLATWFLEALRGVPNLRYSPKVDDMLSGTLFLAGGDVLAAGTFGVRRVQGCDAFPLDTLLQMPVCSPDCFDCRFTSGPAP